MFSGFKALDRVLRGETTQLPALERGTIEIPVMSLLVVLIVLGAVAGACTGSNAVITRQNTMDGWHQMMASMAKVPMLFGLTLIITFPSLYVFNALVGSRLNLVSMLKLLVSALSVMMAVVASLGPIIAFFAFSTTSYPFMKLLNVVAYSIAGVLGLGFLLQTLRRLSVVEESLRFQKEINAVPPAEARPAMAAQGFSPLGVPGEVPPPEPSALDRVMPRRPDPRVGNIFRIWVVVFGLVGAQMAWVLRPFIGNPDQPFSFFRQRESNFFQAMADTIAKMFTW